MQGDLFTPFASAKPIYKGLGLGLSLARSIVEDAGGTLAYDPLQNPFQSRFVVRLPAYD
jgi:C4-dicarboxylate-specific signal transduction histidine kinase